MLKNLVAAVVLLTATVFCGGQSQVKAHNTDYQKLVAYLESKPNDRTSIALIVDHLEKFGGTQPLNELIRWAQAGFPEFHNEHGHWRINVLGFHANFENSLYYFIEEYPSTEKGTRYLRLIEELRTYGQFTHPLTQSAYRFLTSEELEAEFYRLVKSKDPDERSRGFVIGLMLANKSPEIASVYLRGVRDERVLRPRYSALAMIATVRGKYPREVAIAGLDRLLNDSDKQVRDLGGVIVRQGADYFSTWSEKDLSLLLLEMLKSRDIETRRTLAMTVAKLTTNDKALYVHEEKWTDHPQEIFLAHVKTLHRSLEGEDLVLAWKEWWTPQISKYMVEVRAVVCE